MTKRSMEFVTPLSVAFEIDGRGLEITPVVVEEVADLLAIADPLFEELMLVDGERLERLQLGAQTTADTVWLLRLVARHAKPVVEALAICSRMHTLAAADGTVRTVTGAEHAAWVRRLLPDRAVELLTVCLRVNADFFTRAFPRLVDLLDRLKPVADDAAGSAPSTGATPSTA